MKLHRIETPEIAHYAYLIADGDQAAIVDPRRDVDEYLDVARSLGVTIRYVLETHRQEDFVMGSSHLSERTGAKVVNGKHDLFGRGDMRLDDGASFTMGDLRFEALHTPGHTPESMSYAVYAGEGADAAWGVFTGDALFFGDTGRTDLPDAGRAAENAGLLYDMVHRKIAPLGDQALILPAHGPGSVCGSGMAELPHSTIGAERQYNAVFCLSREAFSRKKGAENLPRPPFFRLLEEVNLKGGLPPRQRPHDVPLVGPDTFAERSSDGLIIDMREPEAYAGGHIHEAYAIWKGGLPVFGGWIAEADTPLYLVGNHDAEAAEAFLHLSRIGMDGVKAALAGGFASWRSSGRPIATSGVITPRQLAETRSSVQLLDVREKDEFDEAHIPEARHVYVGYLEERLDDLELQRDRPIVVTCSVGHRAGLAASILRRAGFSDVRNLLGGMTAYQALDLAVEEKKR